MFGLFQVEIPIGRRLWLMFLVLIAVGVLKPSLLPAFQSDPIQFATDLLLLFGAISLLGFFLAIPIVVVRVILISPLLVAIRRTSEESTFWQYANTTGMRAIDRLVLEGSFFAAVLIVLSYMETPAFRWLGFVGLCFVILLSVFATDDESSQQDVICAEFGKSWVALIVFSKGFEAREILIEGEFIGFQARITARLLMRGWQPLSIPDRDKPLQLWFGRPVNWSTTEIWAAWDSSRDILHVVHRIRCALVRK